MARVPEITNRDDVPADKQHIYDEITGSRGRVGGPFAVLMNSPECAGRVAHLGTYLRFESVLPDSDRELAISTTARHWECEVEWGGHSRMALESGVTQETIDTVWNQGAAGSLPPNDALIVNFVRELLQTHRVPDPLFDAAKSKYGAQGVTELATLIGYYSMLACVLNACEVKAAARA